MAAPADASSIYLPNASYADGAVVYKPTRRDPLVTPDADDEILGMMQGVVQRGTGIAVAAVGKPLAGKTGTTSDWFDAWFLGFSPDLVAGVFVGFDEPRTLGDGETGGHVAAPIFRDFMTAALKDKPAKPFPAPTAAPVVANAGEDAKQGSGSSKASPFDVASLTPPGANPDDTDPATVDATTRGKKQRDNAAVPDPAATPWYYGAPQWPNASAAYGAPQPLVSQYGAPAYAAAPVPNYGAPYAPSYGAAPYMPSPAYYGAPPMPAYRPAPGGPRPGFGTGGLY